MSEQMSPSQTGDTDYFKRIGFSLIASEPVAEVDCSEQAGVEETDSGFRRAIGFIREIGIPVDGEAEYWCKPPSDTQSGIRIQSFQPCMACGLRSHAAIDTDVEIIGCLARSKILGRHRNCHHQDSNE